MSALPQPTLRPITTTVDHPPHDADDAQHQQAQGMLEHDYCCRTPTSPQSQLPSSELANMICPPAPRKPRRRAVLMRPRKRPLLQDLESEEYYSDLESAPAPEVITVSMKELEAAFRRRRKPAGYHRSTETNGNYCRKRKRYISSEY